jgi:hypothetical protein
LSHQTTYTSGLAYAHENDEQEAPSLVFAPGHGHTPSLVTAHALTHVNLTHPNHVVPSLAILAHPNHVIPGPTILVHPNHVIPGPAVLIHHGHSIPIHGGM